MRGALKSPASRRARPRQASDVPEPQKPDTLTLRVKTIRDLRLRKAETELAQAGAACARSRQDMRDSRGRVFEAEAQAQAHWRQAVSDFQGMVINAKEFVARKCKHQTMKLQAAALRAQAREAVARARGDRDQVRQARRALQDQQLQVEKLRLMREVRQQEADQSVALA